MYRTEKYKIGTIDGGARSILRALEIAGYEAYVVGGCVRDLLMGRISHDWDITTSAHPETVLRISETKGWKTIDVGGRMYGTVIIVVDGVSYEVTTFRKERYGGDSHRPTEVTFSDSLEEDVARRDFTVNAMALDQDGVLYDYFDGAKDLEKKRLRTVGEGEARFQEDALRLFRACRFLGQLDFMADRSLVKAMKPAFPRVAGLSLDRVKGEIERLLVTPHAARGLDLLVRTGLCDCVCRVKKNGEYHEVPILPELSHLVDLPQMRQFHCYDGWMHTLAVVDASRADLTIRWAALLHDVAKGMLGIRAVNGERITDYNHDLEGAEMTEALLERWGYGTDFRRRVCWLVANHMQFHYFANNEEADAVRWVRRFARSGLFHTGRDLSEALDQLTEVCCADVVGCGRPQSATEGHRAFGAYLQEVCKKMPVSTHELKYDESLIDTLGTHVGEGLTNLLLRVQNGTLENTPKALADAAVRYIRRHSSENS